MTPKTFWQSPISLTLAISLCLLGACSFSSTSGDLDDSRLSETEEARDRELAADGERPSASEGSDAGPIPELFSLDEADDSGDLEGYGRNFIADAAQQVAPAVLLFEISPDGLARVEGESRPPLREFFDDLLPTPRREPRRSQRSSTGSGFIADGSGLAITNAHVVRNADVVLATLADGRQYRARVLGRDELTDLAVVQLETDEVLPSVSFGNSDRLRPGEWVVALGNPLGLNNSVTAGIVSALDRSSTDVRGAGDRRVRFIQTDAAINPGNSGGPLIDIDGNVVGINTAIIQGAEGLGFAIPINEAREIVERLVESGRIVRSYVGIRMITLTDDLTALLREQGDLPSDFSLTTGVYINRLVPNAPAAQGGLREGDVIVALDGEEISTSEGLQSTISELPVGTKTIFTVQRGDKILEIEVVTEELRRRFS